MDKLETYRKILIEVINRHANYASEQSDIESLAICDPSSDNYLLVDVGWEEGNRAHWVVLHLRIRDEKIRIEQDGIEYGIMEDLLDAGVPTEDIIPAFMEPHAQELIDLAVA
ncbi:MAG: XisI protein [Acidobacteria bacterium]|nr:XisI protein [Acidobacteriota bacterium]